MLDSDISTADAAALLHSPERDPWAVDRRRFLQLVGMGMGAGLVAGGPGTSLLDHFALGHDPSAWAAGPVGQNDGILVVLGMFGGNDGLNSVVPFNDPLYYTQHGSLAIAGNQTLPIASGLGLNPALTTVKQLWDAGQVAVVQGVGYPNADFSHFNSMAYWMAGRVGGIPSSGWLGRWLDGYLGGGRDLYAAAEVGYSVPLHLVGNAQRGTVVPANRPGFGSSAEADDQRLYQAIRGMSSTAVGPWQSAVSQAFSDQLDLASTLSAHYPDDDDLPDDEIVARMEIAARMINANLGFRVLTAGYGDFDSHANQPGMHTARMAELDNAIKRFYEILNPAWRSRVTIMTFSEFGRTSWDNDGQGTDHGSSAPHLVIGANVKGGVYGTHPSLAGLDRWERMPHTVDYRSYYASIIDGWLGGGSSDVLGGNYENLGLFTRAPGVNPDGQPTLPPAVVSPKSLFVPIAPLRVVDTRDGTGGVLIRPIAAGDKVVVPIIGQGGIPAGATAVVANVTATQCSSPTYLTVYPGATGAPNTSNINAGPGLTAPNLVVMGIGTNGAIEVLNAHGTSHCVVDVFGYFTEAGGDGFVATSPKRLFDTRTGQGVRPGKMTGGDRLDITVSGVGDVPPVGASAVALNLTVTEPDDHGWVRATPTGTAAASTSNVNFRPGDTVPNMVICMLGAGGQISIDGNGAPTHVLGDVFGYFSASGKQLRTVPPQRVLDTRIGTGAPAAQLAPKVPLRLGIGGQAMVPNGAESVVLNVTATNVGGPSFITVWPNGESQPGTSNLNVSAGQTVANLVICRLGSEGALQLAIEHTGCDLIADVLGYFSA